MNAKSPTRRNAALALCLIFTFLACGKKEKEAAMTTVADSVYMQQGDRIIAATFDTLRNALLSAIGQHGFDSAISFCNQEAYTLTNIYGDSVIIRRTAARIRNPDNAPDSLEQAVWQAIHSSILEGNKPGNQLIREPDSHEVHYFKPILLQPMCLNCHGNPQKEIQPATLAKIQQLYPHDQAVGFKEGELRGLWHIIFKTKKQNADASL